ncbi:MAG: hypothetical protein ACK576_07010 [Cyclobacteriaceae bacterium]
MPKKEYLAFAGVLHVFFTVKYRYRHVSYFQRHNAIEAPAFASASVGDDT